MNTVDLRIASEQPSDCHPPSLLHLAGLHLLFGIFLPVAAVQAVEAAGPDGAAAGGICHGEGLGEKDI